MNKHVAIYRVRAAGWCKLRRAISYRTNHKHKQINPTPARRAAATACQGEMNIPNKKIPAARPNKIRTKRLGRKTRLNSNLSPVIVSTRNPIHHKITMKIGWPDTQSRLPISQHKTPICMVRVYSAGSRLTIMLKMNTANRLPTVIKRAPINICGKTSKATHPNPLSSGAKNIHFLLRATTRSKMIRDPRNPEIIKGPCSSGKLL